MKNINIFFAIGVGLITSCNTDTTRKFIPGTYVNSDGSEYSVAWDTLAIEPSESNNFLIHRKTGFNMIHNGKLGKHEYETEEWLGIYDKNTKTITESAKGKLITFYPKGNKLLVGRREYRKLKGS